MELWQVAFALLLVVCSRPTSAILGYAPGYLPMLLGDHGYPRPMYGMHNPMPLYGLGYGLGHSLLAGYLGHAASYGRPLYEFSSPYGPAGYGSFGHPLLGYSNFGHIPFGYGHPGLRPLIGYNMLGGHGPYGYPPHGENLYNKGYMGYHGPFDKKGQMYNPLGIRGSYNKETTSYGPYGYGTGILFTNVPAYKDATSSNSRSSNNEHHVMIMKEVEDSTNNNRHFTYPEFHHKSHPYYTKDQKLGEPHWTKIKEYEIIKEHDGHAFRKIVEYDFSRAEPHTDGRMKRSVDLKLKQDGKKTKRAALPPLPIMYPLPVIPPARLGAYPVTQAANRAYNNLYLTTAPYVASAKLAAATMPYTNMMLYRSPRVMYPPFIRRYRREMQGPHKVFSPHHYSSYQPHATHNYGKAAEPAASAYSPQQHQQYHQSQHYQHQHQQYHPHQHQPVVHNAHYESHHPYQDPHLTDHHTNMKPVTT